MANDKKLGPNRKGIPGGFLLVLLAAILVVLGVQAFSSDRSGKVAFSHQAEHLTNLDLIIPEDNQKIAQNDNLVTFSGRFRDAVSSEGEDRYRYLELLNNNHQMQGEHTRLGLDLNGLQKNVEDSADLYLALSGQSLPKNGYTVVGALYDTPERQSTVVIRARSNREVVTLSLAQSALNAALRDGTTEKFRGSSKRNWRADCFTSFSSARNWSGIDQS